MARKGKPDGRRPRSYDMARPPATGVAIERVDDHTACIRSADYLTDETLAFLADVAENYQRATIENVRGGDA